MKNSNATGNNSSFSSEDIHKNTVQNDLLEILSASEKEVKNGRVAPIEDTFDGLRGLLINSVFPFFV
ncbi:MAG: hypothetical protein K5891_09510 [Lachnospiraceae bacterium]|nr:hypothetical protein [Lachnospiraceae bacterium]